MPHELRASLYIYLGSLATFFFTLRFIYQWIKSEKKKHSHVTQGFWKLSLVGNAFMAVHTLIQVQYHFFCIQIINGVIAYQNLGFFTEKRGSIRSFLTLLLLCLSLSTLLFSYHSYLSFGFLKWVTTPSHIFNAYAKQPLSLYWHLFGTMGAILFAMRFWIQIGESFQKKSSHLSKRFWIASLLGSFCTSIYALQLQDWVQVIGYSTGMIPYIRNLYLIKKQKDLR